MIDFTGKTPKYFDRNGVEITEGCTIRYPDGKTCEVFLTEDNRLGIDATNPAWIASGRACACEFGVYPLNEDDTAVVEVID